MILLFASTLFVCALPIDAQSVPATAAQTQPAGAQPASNPEMELKRLGQDILTRRLNGQEETQAELEAPLQILDSLVLQALNSPGEPDLDALNERLAAQVAQDSAAGRFSVQRLNSSPMVYALAANFGTSGPSAARIYARGTAQFQLMARIDRFTRKDFFDDYLVILPVRSQEAVFVTVSGRSDRLATGMFAAWRFAHGTVEPLWASDLLMRSSYDAVPDGLRITYCAQPDEDRPSVCRKMIRKTYKLQGGEWKAVEQADLPPPAH